MKSSNQNSESAVCTIVSKNYLHYARTLMASVRAVHPDWKQYVLLVDEIDGAFDPKQEPFEVIEAARLPLPEKQKFLFRYTILELNTAVKPWFLEWLFENRGAKRVVYLDPDIYVYRPLTEVVRAFDVDCHMVLTPHLTGELRDGKVPSEADILKAGTYNLGFIAVADHRQRREFLRWWQTRLEFDCRIDFEAGIFVDQKWMNLAPCVFDDVHVLKNPAYNVAYWNLAHRKVLSRGEGRGDAHSVNGEPLVFFHFSGLNPASPGPFSKYQNRFQMSNLGDVVPLVRRYCDEVRKHGLETCKAWPYAFGRFRNGKSISDQTRIRYRESPLLQALAGDDPFSADFDALERELHDPGRLSFANVTGDAPYGVWFERVQLLRNLTQTNQAEIGSRWGRMVAAVRRLFARLLRPVFDRQSACNMLLIDAVARLHQRLETYEQELDAVRGSAEARSHSSQELLPFPQGDQESLAKAM